MHNKLYKNSFPTFIDLINKRNYTQIRMYAMHKNCMLHQAISISCSTCPTHAPLNQELQQVFIDKHLQGTTPIPTFKKVVGHYLTHIHQWT